MSSLKVESFAALGRDENGARFAAEESSPRPAKEKQKKSSLFQMDLYDGNRPAKVGEIYQTTLGDLCGMISERFKLFFHNYKGCTFRIAANGVLQLVFVFSPAISNPQVGEFPPIVNIRKFGNNNKTGNSNQYPPGSNADFAEKHFKQQQRNIGRMTMTLTDETRDYMKRFMIFRVDGNNKRVLNWNDCIEEVEINSQIMNAGRPESILILSNIDLQKIVNSILIPSNVIFADEHNAVLKWMDEHGYDSHDKDLVKHYCSSEQMEEIYDELKIFPSMGTVIVYKGYRLDDMNGNVIYNPNPFQPVVAGALPTLRLDKYYINIELADLNVVRANMPNRISFQNTGSLVLY